MINFSGSYSARKYFGSTPRVSNVIMYKIYDTACRDDVVNHLLLLDDKPLKVKDRVQAIKMN